VQFRRAELSIGGPAPSALYDDAGLDALAVGAESFRGPPLFVVPADTWENSREGRYSGELGQT
jgi:hypothetical protein